MTVTRTCALDCRLTSPPFSSFSVFSMQILRYKSSVPSIAIWAFSGSLGCGDTIIFSTIPGRLTLGSGVAILQQVNLAFGTKSEQKGTLYCKQWVQTHCVVSQDGDSLRSKLPTNTGVLHESSLLGDGTILSHGRAIRSEWKFTPFGECWARYARRKDSSRCTRTNCALPALRTC